MQWALDSCLCVLVYSINGNTDDSKLVSAEKCKLHNNIPLNNLSKFVKIHNINFNLSKKTDKQK